MGLPMRLTQSVWSRLQSLRRWLSFLGEPAAQNIIAGAVGAAVGTIVGFYVGGCPTETPPPADIANLIRQEATLALNSSRAGAAAAAYSNLFTEGAVIRDIIGGEVWHGRAEIRRRFLGLKPFSILTHNLLENPKLMEEGRSARARTSTTFRIGREDPAGGDEEWHFKKIGREWKIDALFYGLPLTR
jgi:hypothetical protein